MINEKFNCIILFKVLIPDCISCQKTGDEDTPQHVYSKFSCFWSTTLYCDYAFNFNGNPYQALSLGKQPFYLQNYFVSPSHKHLRFNNIDYSNRLRPLPGEFHYYFKQDDYAADFANDIFDFCCWIGRHYQFIKITNFIGRIKPGATHDLVNPLEIGIQFVFAS